ncbi:hypothetical protein GJ496_008435 [Pomphorhynchus laevis]|nr:hypothetical protein GJ496_008435 [Pomphorhynchus laevis]
MVGKLRNRIPRGAKRTKFRANPATSPPKPAKKVKRNSAAQNDDNNNEENLPKDGCVESQMNLDTSFASDMFLDDNAIDSQPNATDNISVTFGSLQLAPTPMRHIKRPSSDIKVSLEVDKSCEGELLAFGDGSTGQLGMGDEILRRKKPQLVSSLSSNIVQISAGGMHSLALDANGKVFSWGCNDDYALGRITQLVGSDDAEALEFIPQLVELHKPAVQISAGDSHSACLLQDGTVYIWGAFRNASGLIGLRQFEVIEKKPVRVDLSEHIVKISSGCDHLAMLSTSGHVYSIGNAQQGQLGRVGRFKSDYGGRTGLAKLLDPDIVRCQAYRDIRKPKKFIDVWCGPYSTFVKDEFTNRILACGLNNYYQLGHVKSECQYALVPVLLSKEKNWIQIAAGLHHTLALNDDGEVYAFGRPEYGRLGLGTDDEVVIEPTRIDHLIKNGDPIIQIACGGAVSFAVSRSGKVYSWGMGANFQTGHGEDDIDLPTEIKSKQLETRSALKVSAGGQHTLLLALTNDLNLKSTNES